MRTTIMLSLFLTSGTIAASGEIDDWRFVGNDARGFRLYIPQEWVPLDTDSPDFEKAVEAFKKVDVPEPEADTGDVADLDWSFAATDISERSTQDGFMENITVVTVPESQSMDALSIKVMKNTARRAFPWAEPPESGLVEIGMARLFHYRGVVAGTLRDGQTWPFHIEAFVVPHGPLTHVLTFSSGLDRIDEMKDIALTVVKNMQLRSFPSGGTPVIRGDEEWTISTPGTAIEYETNVYGAPTQPIEIEPLTFSLPPARSDEWTRGAMQTRWDQRNR